MFKCPQHLFSISWICPQHARNQRKLFRFNQNYEQHNNFNLFGGVLDGATQEKYPRPIDVKNADVLQCLTKQYTYIYFTAQSETCIQSERCEIEWKRNEQCKSIGRKSVPTNFSTVIAFKQRAMAHAILNTVQVDWYKVHFYASVALQFGHYFWERNFSSQSFKSLELFNFVPHRRTFHVYLRSYLL